MRRKIRSLGRNFVRQKERVGRVTGTTHIFLLASSICGVLKSDPNPPPKKKPNCLGKWSNSWYCRLHKSSNISKLFVWCPLRDATPDNRWKIICNDTYPQSLFANLKKSFHIALLLWFFYEKLSHKQPNDSKNIIESLEIENTK